MRNGRSAAPTTNGKSKKTRAGTTSGGSASTLTYNNDGQLCWRQAATVTAPSCTTVPTGATLYTYNAAGDRITTTPAPAGGGATHYTYDQDQHLATLTPPSGIPTTYTYDGNGLRLSKTTSGITTHFTWNQSTGLPLLLSDATNRYIYGLGGQPLEQVNVATGAVTWLHHDQLGSTRLATSSTGAAVRATTYDPYGTVVTSTGTVPTPLGFDGQYTDTESGLSYLRARYYDPSTAQFLTIDPLVASTLQPYSYTTDNPLNADDPSGMCSLWAWICNAPAHAYSGLEGAANAITFGGVAALDEAISPGSTCTYAHDGYYAGGAVAGFVAAAVITGGASAEVDAAETVNEGICVINGAGGTYVGQSGNIAARFVQHLVVNGGRFTQPELAAAERTAVSGGKTAREIAEQQKIDELGGVKSLINIRNPIGQGRLGLMPQPYSRP